MVSASIFDLHTVVPEALDSLPHDGFIKNGRIAWISALLISVIVVAIAVTVSIMSRYFYRKESRLKNAEKEKRD